MACLKPITAFYSSTVNPTGKRSLVFNPKGSHSGIPVRIPCGRCIECRLSIARDKAVRGAHEHKMWAPTHDSSFITLTYDTKNLPGRDVFPSGNLCMRDVQLFMKRLRKHFSDIPVRFQGCGEYGETNARPHYHIILYNVGFADKRRCGVGKRGDPLYSSVLLDTLWPMGRTVIGNVTFDSISYVCGYVTKKITGDAAEAHYGGRCPEFPLGSRRPGIGKLFFDRYKEEMFRDDSCILKGKEVAIPKYYNIKFEGIDPKRLLELKKRRRLLALSEPRESSRRKRVKELVTLAKLSLKGSQL